MTIADPNSEITRVGATPGQYPVNLRFTIPFYPQPLFVTLIIGREKRGRDRLREERHLHPIQTWGNLLTVAATWTMISISALFAVLVVSAL
ncbi:MAG: hypothetical protein ACKVG0_04680 [Alphaproteobacteria bacterium]|jgi:hypothetical protein